MNTKILLHTLNTAVVSLLKQHTQEPLRVGDRAWYWVAMPGHPDGGFYLPSIEEEHDDDSDDDEGPDSGNEIQACGFRDQNFADPEPRERAALQGGVQC